MEKILGLGGFFFRAKDPKALTDWYETHFGINRVGQNYGEPAWQQKSGTTVFAPFNHDTDYFGVAEKTWAINFRVANLGRMVEQLRAAGIEVTIDPETYPNGRFATLHDPERNRIELWQPIPAE